MNGIFTTMDGDKGARRRGIISAVAAAAMLLPLAFAPTAMAFAPTAMAADPDYPGGIKGEYNPLGINAGVAIETDTLPPTPSPVISAFLG